MSNDEPAAAMIYRVPFSSIVQEAELSRFERELEELRGDGPGGRYAVDFTGTYHLSSRALGVLVAFFKRVQEQRGRVVLFGANPAIEKVMKVTKLDTLMPVLADEQAALAKLGALGANTNGA